MFLCNLNNKHLLPYISSLILFISINDGGLVDWSEWSPFPPACSRQCGRGQYCRTRRCFDPFGSELSHENCSTHGRVIECLDCYVNIVCPKTIDLPTWLPWTECVPVNYKLRDRHNCLTGNRYHLKISFTDDNKVYDDLVKEEVPCKTDCFLNPRIDLGDSAGQIAYRMLKDHFEFYYRQVNTKQVVFTKAPKEGISLDCNTEAIAFANVLKVRDEQIAGSLKMDSGDAQPYITWYKNGYPLVYFDSFMRNKFTKNFPQYMQNLYDVEMSLRHRGNNNSAFTLKDNRLSFQTLTVDDSGMYSCHLNYRGRSWIARYFSLYVKDVVHDVEDNTPFWLISGLGVRNVLADGLLGIYDIAQISWYLNDELMYRGMTAYAEDRVLHYGQFNASLQGEWKCFLDLTLPMSHMRAAVVMGDNLRASRILINRFTVRMKATTGRPSETFFADILRNNPGLTNRTLFFFGFLAFWISLAYLLLTIFVLILWSKESVSLKTLKVFYRLIMFDGTKWYLIIKERSRKHLHFIEPLAKIHENAVSETWADLYNDHWLRQHETFDLFHRVYKLSRMLATKYASLNQYVITSLITRYRNAYVNTNIRYINKEAELKKGMRADVRKRERERALKEKKRFKPMDYLCCLCAKQRKMTKWQLFGNYCLCCLMPKLEKNRTYTKCELVRMYLTCKCRSDGKEKKKISKFQLCKTNCCCCCLLTKEKGKKGSDEGPDCLDYLEMYTRCQCLSQPKKKKARKGKRPNKCLRLCRIFCCCCSLCRCPRLPMWMNKVDLALRKYFCCCICKYVEDPRRDPRKRKLSKLETLRKDLCCCFKCCAVDEYKKSKGRCERLKEMKKRSLLQACLRKLFCLDLLHKACAPCQRFLSSFCCCFCCGSRRRRAKNRKTATLWLSLCCLFWLCSPNIRKQVRQLWIWEWCEYLTCAWVCNSRIRERIQKRWYCKVCWILCLCWMLPASHKVQQKRMLILGEQEDPVCCVWCLRECIMTFCGPCIESNALRYTIKFCCCCYYAKRFRQRAIHVS